MIRLTAGLAFFAVGCVPLPVHQELQKKLSAVSYDRNALTRNLRKCERQNKHLIDALKAKPTTIIERSVPGKEPLKPEELDAIKKKALDNAERSFKERMRK